MKCYSENRKTISQQFNSAAVGFLHQESTVKASDLLFCFLLIHLFFCVTGMNSFILDPGETTFDIVYSCVVYLFFAWIGGLDIQRKKKAIKNFIENIPDYMSTARQVSCVVFLALFVYFVICGCSALDSAWVSLLIAFFCYLSAILPIMVAGRLLNSHSLFYSLPRFIVLPHTEDTFPTRPIPVPLSPPRVYLAA